MSHVFFFFYQRQQWISLNLVSTLQDAISPKGESASIFKQNKYIIKLAPIFRYK